jgi:hypothetical protein
MTNEINIKVKYICYGSEYIKFTIGGKRYRYEAGYMGPEPLSDLILAVATFIWKEEDEYKTTWDDEPGKLHITMTRDVNNRDLLHVDAHAKGDFVDPKTNMPWIQDDKYHFDVSLEALRIAVVKEGLRMLKEYGLRGFDGSWGTGENTFPLKTLLILMGSSVAEVDDSYKSNFFDELNLLMTNLKQL